MLQETQASQTSNGTNPRNKTENTAQVENEYRIQITFAKRLSQSQFQETTEGYKTSITKNNEIKKIGSRYVLATT